jgi:hypothetical protein
MKREGRLNMKRKALIFFMVLSLSLFIGGIPSSNNALIKGAAAGGIPTISIAELMQQLISYLTQIMQYSEDMSNTSSNAATYAQLVLDYQQKLREYQHYLNQLQSIRHMISNRDWQLLMQTIRMYYGKSLRSVVATMDIDSSTYETDLDKVLGKYSYVPRDPSLVQSEALGLNMWTQQLSDEVNQDYNNFDLYKDRMRIVSENADRSRKRQNGEIQALKDGLNSLGDESDLATLQLIAAENLTMIKQKEQLLEIQNQQLMHNMNEEAMAAARRAKARDDEINRLTNRQNTQTPGKARFGKL